MKPPPAAELAPLLEAPYRDRLPASLVFRTAEMPARARYPRHRHAWGEFVYAHRGVMDVQIGARHCLAPPQHGIWLPPQVEHRGLNRGDATHSSLYVAAELCAGLPAEACAMAVGPLARALLDDLRTDPPAQPPRPEDTRRLQVLVDQLRRATPIGSWLPRSADPALGTVLQWLEADPADPRPLAALAAAVGSTERTLSRRCRRDLGMGFAEWRQRLAVVKALPRLAAGEKVEAIALDLGYAGASAFIAMFRRLTGATPDAHRRRT